jgi:hypothetical protein
MRGYPIESKTGRQWTPQPPETCDRVFPAAVTTHFKLPFPRNADPNLVAVFKFKRFDNRCGEPDGKAITPFGYLHGTS